MIKKKKDPQYFTGATGLAHLRRVMFGKNFIVYESGDGSLLILPDMPSAEAEAHPRYDGEDLISWTRVRALDEADAAEHAIRAHDYYREDYDPDDHYYPPLVWKNHGNGLWIPQPATQEQTV